MWKAQVCHLNKTVRNSTEQKVQVYTQGEKQQRTSEKVKKKKKIK